jgi:LacI family transcriptional regulator
MENIRRIALLLGQEIGYCREVLRGVQQYAVHRRKWVFRDAPPETDTLKPLREWQPHGIIGLFFHRDVANAVVKLKIPLVNTTSTLADWSIPLVEVDHDSVGRLAAEYFLEKGYRNFGFFGSAWTHVSRTREAGYRQRLAATGFELATCHAEYLPRPPVGASWRHVDDQVERWLRTLPKPVAILCSNDVPARDLADVCRQLELRVPQEVALLGVDNDELECGLTWPSLSSIELPGQRIGYEAARILDDLMRGKKQPAKPLFLPPVRVVTRQSTDTLAVENATVAAALDYIRANLSEEFTVDDIAAGAGVGRRDLERKFRAALDRSVLDEVRTARIDRVKQLLADTELSMAAVAQRAGFSGSRRMAVVFREVTGATPRQYRRRIRGERLGESSIAEYKPTTKRRGQATRPSARVAAEKRRNQPRVAK